MSDEDRAEPGDDHPLRRSRSAHVDAFARDRLPPPAQLPEFVFDGPDLQLPERLNAAVALLDAAVDERGWGERPCLLGEGVAWSYAALRDEVDRIAGVLVRRLGLVPGNRVLLRGANTPRLAACWLAVVKAGGIVVGTMPLLRARELAVIIDKAQVSHALCDARLAEELLAAQATAPVLRSVCLFGTPAAPAELEALAAAEPAGFDACDTAATDVALIAFTSGTTGVPKGTLHLHRDLIAACRCWPPQVLRAEAGDRFIGSPPLAFTFGLGGLLLFPLDVGASTVLLEKASPDALLPAIAAYGATVCVTAPTSYRAMAAKVGEHVLHTLRKCVSAGEALPAATRTLWREATGIEIIDGIGSTELFHIFISAREDQARGGATGLPVPGYRAAILDDEGHELPPGQVGRLAVKGPTGCKYLDDPRQAQYVQNGWNLTGDAYLVDPVDGQYVYQARTDDMIVSGGYNIAGPEVEAALLAHPAVAECGVVGKPDEARGTLVKAFVVLRPGFEPGAARVAELQDFVKRTIAPYKYPREIEFRASLPRTETGKLQRFRLKQGA